MDLRIAGQWFYQSPPRAYGASGPQGQELVVATTTTAGVVSLRALTFGEVYNAGAADTQTGSGAPAAGAGGVVGSFLTIFADTGDLGVIVGPTLASVTGGNVPALATVGTVNGSGIYTAAAGVCHRIPAGQERRWRLQVGKDEFLGFVASAAGQMRLFMSSAPNTQG